MLRMPASRKLLKEEVVRAETMVNRAIREPEGVIRLAKVNHLVLLGRINPGRSRK